MAKKSKTTKTFNPKDHYQEVTDRLVAIMEQGRKPWDMPWDENKAGLMSLTAPVNATTGKRYRGINLVVLLSDDKAVSSQDPRWCSYKQATDAGWQVRKDEKSTTVYFYRKITKKADEGTDDDNTFFVMKSFPVFHASQIAGIPDYVPPVITEEFNAPEAAQVIIDNSGADFRIGGSRAFYSPSKDFIQMPPGQAFKTPEDWAATSLHELGHWTGHNTRLDRKFGTKSGDKTAYAREELRAELASVFIGSELGLTGEIQNHANYLSSWLNVLKDDKKEIFKAAADAQRIADYCLKFHPELAKRFDTEEVKSVAQEQADEQEEMPHLQMTA